MSKEKSSTELPDDFDIWLYVRAKKIQLGQDIAKKKAIFLDLNYWIELRQARLGNSSSSLYDEILVIAKALVQEGKCIFPITDSMFFEVLKQDGQRLKETVELIDMLSNGVCIEERDVRIDFELMDFLNRLPGVEKYTARELLWTKTYFIFHNKLPFSEGLDPDAQNVMLKSFVDWNWDKKFGDFLRMFEGHEFGGFSYPDNSEELNRGKQNHTDEYNTFHQLFLNEVAGSIDILKDQIDGATLNVFEKIAGNSISEEIAREVQDSDKTRKMIYNIFRLKKANTFLPFINIMSGCHASIRWDAKHAYEGNHAFDFEHASCALPYTDYFFCEKQLKHIVTQNSLGHDKLYSCEVASKPSDALRILKGL